MAKCHNCGRTVDLPFKCRYCGGLFCEDCRLPPKHNCPGINLWASRSPPSDLKGEDGGYIPVKVKPSTSYVRTTRRRKKKSNKLKVLVFLLLVVSVGIGLYYNNNKNFSFLTGNNGLGLALSNITQSTQVSSPTESRHNVIQISTPTIPPKPTPVDLREKLWRYELKYALEVALSSSELSKIKDLANKLKGKDIRESAWNVLEWEDKNIEYDYIKANISPPTIYYTRDPYYGVITDVEVVGGTKDYYQTPYETIKKGKGVCRDYAILTAGLLLAMNYSPVYIFDISYENSDTKHLVASIKINSHYFILDQHPPVWDLGRYYYHSVEEGKYIKNATVYVVYKGNGFASVKTLGILTAEDFKKDTYVITSFDLREIQKLLLNRIEEEFHLQRDYSIYDLDERVYLPSGYSYGKVWTLKYPSEFYHPEFKDCFARYVINDLKSNSEIMSDIKKCNRFWLKVETADKYIVIKLLLAKW